METTHPVNVINNWYKWFLKFNLDFFRMLDGFFIMIILELSWLDHYQFQLVSKARNHQHQHLQTTFDIFSHIHYLLHKSFYIFLNEKVFLNWWKGSKRLPTKIVSSFGHVLPQTKVFSFGRALPPTRIASLLAQTPMIISPSMSMPWFYNVYSLMQMSPLHKMSSLVHLLLALCIWWLDSACIWHLVSHCLCLLHSPWSYDHISDSEGLVSSPLHPFTVGQPYVPPWPNCQMCWGLNHNLWEDGDQ